MEAKKEQQKKEGGFRLTVLNPEQHAVTSVPKFTTELPFFYFTKNKNILGQDIHYKNVDPTGKPIRWEVTPNRSPKIGVPGIEAHTIWIRLVKPVMDVYGIAAARDIPEILPLGGIRECLRVVGWREGGWEARALLQGLMQIGQSTCDVDFFLPTRQVDSDGQPLFKSIKAIFNRFTIWKIGSKHLSEEELATGNFNFDFDLGDTLYLQLHKIEREIQSSQNTRHLDNQYLFSVGPTARCWYQFMAGKIFGVVKNRGSHCELLYSDYVNYHHTLVRQMTHENIVRQMNKIVRDHLDSGYISSVEYQRIKEPGKPIDFLIRYYPGKEAKESVRRVLSGLNKKPTLPTKNKWSRFPKEKKNKAEPTSTIQSETLGTTGILDESLPQSNPYLLPAPKLQTHPKTPKELLQALTDRGVVGALALLQTLSPVQLDQAPDWIEYYDKIQGQKTPGLLIKLLRSTDPLPSTFESSRERKKRQIEAEHRQRLRDARESLDHAYANYQQEAIDRHINDNLPEGEYTHRVEAEKQKFMNETSDWLKNPNSQLIQTLAEQAVRKQIAHEIASVSFEEFCRREARNVLSKHRVDPAELGIVTEPERSVGKSESENSVTPTD